MLTLNPLTCHHLHAQAPARALYKEVRGQRFVATPHTPFSCFIHFVLFFVFSCFHYVPRTLCAPVHSLGYGPRSNDSNTNLAPLGTTALYEYVVPYLVQHTAGQGITLLNPQVAQNVKTHQLVKQLNLHFHGRNMN